MIETQLAQIVVAIPIDTNGKIPAQPENSRENVKAVTTRGGKTLLVIHQTLTYL